MKRNTFALLGAFSATLLLSGCGGGGTTGLLTSQIPVPTSRSMGTAGQAALTGAASNLRTSASTGSGLAASVAEEVALVSDLLRQFADYTGGASSRATYSKQIGGLTATLNTTETLTALNYSVVLNGAVSEGGTGYNNFTWATGKVTLGQLNGKPGTKQTVTFNELKAGGSSSVVATGEMWLFLDGTGQGFLSTTAGAFFTYAYDSAGNWTWNAYTGGDASTGKLRAQVNVNADGSGAARAFCVEDNNKRAEATWTVAKSGEACAFDTACGSRDSESPCRAFPQ